MGPGERYALWLQGCSRNCPGCMTPESQPLDGGRLISVDELAKEILATQAEGVTVSGGEPFLQAAPLLSLLKAIRQESDKSVIIYTGYYLKDLIDLGNPDIDEILGTAADILIDGPFVEALNDGGSLRGSSNQTAHALTERYRDVIDEIYGQPRRRCEIRFNENEALLVGVPDSKSYDAWRAIFLKGKKE
ncbi:MAG: radical SAM protein [Clostridiales bacterium]|nr:radical SAM protein [Clostridiales bacterium]